MLLNCGDQDIAHDPLLWDRYTYHADRHHHFKEKRKYIGVALSVHDTKPVEAALDAAATSAGVNLVLSACGAIFLGCLIGIPFYWLGVRRTRANQFPILSFPHYSKVVGGKLLRQERYD